VTGTGNTVTASLCDGGTTYDSAIEVYCGDCAAGLNCVVGLDDFCGLQTQVSWCSQATVTYYVRIHGFFGSTGGFNLVMSDDGVACTATVECLPTGACCANDDSCSITTEAACAAAGGDYAGDGVACSTSGGSPITYSRNPNLAIPDGPSAGVSDTMTVADSRVIGDVNVDVNILHTWVGDLNVDLTHVGSGTTVRIIERQGLAGGSDCLVEECCGCGSDNFDVTLDDEAATTFEAQCANNLIGSFRPFAALSAFDGLNSASDWTLSVCDGFGADVGTLVDWSITTELAGEDTCPLCAGDRGDVNCSGAIDFFDIDPFLLGLFDLATYQATYCGGSICAIDIDCSGAVDFFDIDPFLACLFGACPPCP
jgi:subtilisin-like proprotein convertase family protein